MTFGLPTIALMAAGALAYGLFCPPRARAWALFLASLLAAFALQPALPIRFSDYVFPAAGIILVAACWVGSRAPGQPFTRHDGIAFALMLAAILGLSLLRLLPAVRDSLPLVPSRPPNPLHVAGVLAACTVAFAGLAFAFRRRPNALAYGLIVTIVMLFVVLKSNLFGASISGAWRGAAGQDVSLASLVDLNWIGFSYLAFRLIHTLRDRQSGLLPALGLRDYALYALFFPAYTAGPIDRAERFKTDIDALPTLRRADVNRFWAGGTRIAVGLFKKFAIADALAFGLSLNAQNAAQAEPGFGLWLLLYGYALRLFFDFSGYTDIAIGLGILFGVRLPENFNAPYLKTNITAFWQSWHMSLSAWARAYIFSPLTRAMMKANLKPQRDGTPPARKRYSPDVIVLCGHLATMTVIGLWHGMTANFLIWGLWHAAALFLHKLWSDRTRGWYRGLNARPAAKRAWSLAGWFITFHVVLFGWVWFALPDPALALRVFGRLLGLS